MKLRFSRSMFISENRVSCFFCIDLIKTHNGYICRNVDNSKEINEDVLNTNFRKCSLYQQANNWKKL